MLDDEKSLPIGEKHTQTPLDLILKNPKLTPIFLFVLAIVPPLTIALVVSLIFLN